MARPEEVANNERRRPRAARSRSRSTSLSPPRRYSRTPATTVDPRYGQNDCHGIFDSADEARGLVDRRRNSGQKLLFEDIRDRESRGSIKYRDEDRNSRVDSVYRDRYRNKEDRVVDDGKNGDRIGRDAESLEKKASSYGSREHEEKHRSRKREDNFGKERHHSRRREDDSSEERQRRKKREDDLFVGSRYNRKSGDDYGQERHHSRKIEYGSGDNRSKHGMKSSDHTGEYKFFHRHGDSSSNDQNLPELYGIYRAKVQSIRPFGIFVRIEGFFKQGLVHISQLSDHEVTDREDLDEVKVQAIGAIASEGDEVWVKVISLKDEGDNVKIGCSLKLVSQSTGKDLDPSNVKLDQQQRLKGSRSDPKKLALDAIYNVMCSRCGGHGHLKTECFASGDKTYELIPEEEDELLEEPTKHSQGQMLSANISSMSGFGRGRSMVLPAWMTHGDGVIAKHLGDELNATQKKKKASELPDNVTTVKEALALLAQVKKDKKEKKHRKKDGDKHKKEERSKKDHKKKVK